MKSVFSIGEGQALRDFASPPGYRYPVAAFILLVLVLALPQQGRASAQSHQSDAIAVASERFRVSSVYASFDPGSDILITADVPLDALDCCLRKMRVDIDRGHASATARYLAQATRVLTAGTVVDGAGRDVLSVFAVALALLGNSSGEIERLPSDMRHTVTGEVAKLREGRPGLAAFGGLVPAALVIDESLCTRAVGSPPGGADEVLAMAYLSAIQIGPAHLEVLRALCEAEELGAAWRTLVGWSVAAEAVLGGASVFGQDGDVVIPHVFVSVMARQGMWRRRIVGHAGIAGGGTPLEAILEDIDAGRIGHADPGLAAMVAPVMLGRRGCVQDDIRDALVSYLGGDPGESRVDVLGSPAWGVHRREVAALCWLGLAATKQHVPVSGAESSAQADDSVVVVESADPLYLDLLVVTSRLIPIARIMDRLRGDRPRSIGSMESEIGRLQQFVSGLHDWSGSFEGVGVVAELEAAGFLRDCAGMSWGDRARVLESCDVGALGVISRGPAREIHVQVDILGRMVECRAGVITALVRGQGDKEWSWPASGLLERK